MSGDPRKLSLKVKDTYVFKKKLYAKSKKPEGILKMLLILQKILLFAGDYPFVLKAYILLANQ